MALTDLGEKALYFKNLWLKSDKSGKAAFKITYKLF